MQLHVLYSVLISCQLGLIPQFPWLRWYYNPWHHQQLWPLDRLLFCSIKSDSKSPQVSRTLLSILAVFNNAVVWMVSTQPSTSKSSRPFNNPLVTMPKAPITISIIVTFMFHSFFNSLARSRHLSLFSHSFSFIHYHYYYYYYYYYLNMNFF